METQVKNLSTKELKSLIHDTVKDVIEDYIEDIMALSSNNYLKSIEEARKDYGDGKCVALEELENV